jgi:hypothetical protein
MFGTLYRGIEIETTSRLSAQDVRALMLAQPNVSALT